MWGRRPGRLKLCPCWLARKKKIVCVLCVCVNRPHPALRYLTSFFHSQSFPTLINTFQYLPPPSITSGLSKKNSNCLTRNALRASPGGSSSFPYFSSQPRSVRLLRPPSLRCVTLAEHSWEICAWSSGALEEARGGNEGEIFDHLATM